MNLKRALLRRLLVPAALSSIGINCVAADGQSLDSLSVPVVVVDGSEVPRGLVGVRDITATEGGVAILETRGGRVLFMVGPAEGGEWTLGSEVRQTLQIPLSLASTAEGGVTVWNRLSRAVVELSPDGTLVRSQVAPEGGPLSWGTADGDGEWVAITGHSRSVGSPSAITPQPGSVLAGTDSLQTILPLPPFGPIILSSSADATRSFAGGIAVADRLADAIPHADVTPQCGGLVAIATGGMEFKIQLLNGKGQLLGSAVLGTLAPRVEDRDKEAFLLRQSPEMRKGLEEQEGVIPERWPAITGLHFAANGVLFIGEPDRPPSTSKWGAWLPRETSGGFALERIANLAGPEGWEPREIAHGLIWGVAHDSNWRSTVIAFHLPASLKDRSPICAS